LLAAPLGLVVVPVAHAVQLEPSSRDQELARHREKTFQLHDPRLDQGNPVREKQLREERERRLDPAPPDIMRDGGPTPWDNSPFGTKRWP
jgi:hypothetical protein